MTLRVNYLGTADFRVVKRTDMIARGLSDPGQDLIWSKLNGYELDLPNDVAAFLLSEPDFQSDEELSYGEVLAEAFGGRLLGVAELQAPITYAGASAVAMYATQVEVEATGKPLMVSWDGPTQNSSAGQGVQVLVYEGATCINNCTPFQGSLANLPFVNSVRCTRVPPRGLVVYSVKFLKFTQGTAAIPAGALSPATLAVVEL